MRTKLLTPQDKITKMQIEIGRKLSAEYKEYSKIVYPYRLLIIKELYLHKTSFKNLKRVTTITDGNLASHLRSLEENKIIEVIKEFENRRPKTSYILTKHGVKLYERLEKFLEDVIGLRCLNNKMEKQS